MKKKVLLAVYGITIVNDTKDSQLPSQFGGGTDLLKSFYDFAMNLYTGGAAEMPRPGDESIALAAPEQPYPLPKIVESDREVYGYFDTGRNGEILTVRQLASKNKKGKDKNKEDKTVANITRDMHVTREVFFYLKVPKAGKKAYLILQRAQGLGIKGLVEYTFQRYLNINRSQRYGFTLYNLLDRRVFLNMLQSGQFKELTIIRKGIPEDINDLNNRSKVIPLLKDTTQKISYKAVDLPDSWQKWAVDLMTTKGRTDLTMTEGEVGVDISIGGEEQFVSEVTFKLVLNEKQKTFHVVHSKNDQPDVDVTNEVDRDENTGMLDLTNLVEQARALVDDVNFGSTSQGSVDEETGEVIE